MFKVNSNLAMLVLVAILTLNYTESALFKVGFGVTTFYFIAAYVAVSVFHFRIREFNNDEENRLEKQRY